jgi:hypothetical protein
MVSRESSVDVEKSIILTDRIQYFGQRLLIGLVLLWFSWGLMLALPVSATLSQQQEAPGQFLYQSRETLPDAAGHSWQAVLFKRIRADSSSLLYLRLVGYPGTPSPQHPQGLTLKTSTGDIYTAKDVTDAIGESLDQLKNVGQYDLQSIVPQLKPEIPTRLFLSVVDHEPIVLTLNPKVIQEWQTVSDHA